jgi:heme exporter protein A
VESGHPVTPGARAVNVHCDQVGHRFGRQRLFAGVSFSLTGQGSVCVAGPNGSGKSTLMRILAGILEPASGRVTWEAEGRTLAREDRHRRLGFVSPDLHLYGELSVLENMRFFARLRGLQGDDPKWIAHLERFGLEGERRKLYAALSSGLKQRAKYAMAMLHDPPVLFLDEPTANLDRAGRSLVARVMEDQAQRGLLIVATNEEEEYRFGQTLVRVRD